MRPVVNGLETEHPGKLKLVRLDYDVRADLRIARSFHADYHPALVYLRADGSVLRIVIGLQSDVRIRAAVAELLGG